MGEQAHTTVASILKEYLQRNGYDGLCGAGCGCEMSELGLCDSDAILNCRPGYKHKCVPTEDCDCLSGGEVAWCMRPEKPLPPPPEEQGQ